MDVMHLLFLGAACAGAALAYGYRGQRDIEREQVSFLRKQLQGAPDPAPTNARALATIPSGRP